MSNHRDLARQEPTNPFPPLPASQPLPTFPPRRVFVAPVGTPPPPPYMPFIERLQWSDIGVVDSPFPAPTHLDRLAPQ